LPGQNSFLTTGKDVVLSALKLGENPQADFRGESSRTTADRSFLRNQRQSGGQYPPILRFRPTKGMFQNRFAGKNGRIFGKRIERFGTIVYR
jgi:hypothetical protein